MDKKFVMGIAAMAALTLVSCSSDDLDSFSDNSSKNEAISFDGYLGRSAVAVNGTRGSEETVETLKTKGFGVFGNYTPTEGQSSNLFNNQKVHEDASSADKWTYEPVRYWPAQGHIDFFAYAPYKDGTTLTGSKINFDVADQTDLLWAKATNTTKNGGIVTFQFNHALSRLGYSVKLKEAVSESVATITLKKITLAGSSDGTKNAFYKTGIIDLSQENATNLWDTSSSNSNEAKKNFELVSNKTISNAEIKNTDNEYLFVIPQNFSKTEVGADELYVVVEYTIEYQTGSAKPTVSYKVSQKLAYNFEQGKAYTLNLIIGLTPIEFTATVKGWGAIEDHPITLE